jgi:periplasmic protein TonB
MSYIDQKRAQNPVSLLAAVAINGSIIIAVILSPMVAGPRKEKPTTDVFFVPKPKIPPPDKPIDELITPKPFDPVYAPKTIFETPAKEDPIRTSDDPPEAGQGAVQGDGKGEATGFQQQQIDETPIAIFTKARRDSRYARDFQPDYPPSLLVREVEGSATIRVLVGTDGRVRETIIVNASHPDFGKAAVRKALKSWRFKPAMRGDTPVEDWVTIPVTFQIN